MTEWSEKFLHVTASNGCHQAEITLSTQGRATAERGTPRVPVVLAFLLSILGSPAVAQPADSLVAMPAELGAGRFHVVPVTAQGDTLRFYTDTGGGLFVFADAVDRAGLAVDTLVTGSDSLLLARLPELDPAAWIPAPTSPWGAGLPILEGDADRHSLDVGDGILGQAWFGGRVWTFDYPAGRLVLHPDGWASPEGSSDAPLGFLTDSLGNRPVAFPRIQAVVDGDTLDFLFDTGATVVLTEAAREGLDDAGPGSRATSFVTTEIYERWRADHPGWRVIEDADRTVDSMGMIEVPEVRIAGHRVGPVWFTQRPDAAFHEYMARWMDRPVDGALGGNALRFFRVTVDYPGARAVFEPAGDLVSGLPGILRDAAVPGASAAIVEDGRFAWTDGFGVASTETGEPVGPSTVFEAASLSKPVFAYVVLRLVDRGAIDLDRPLAEYLAYERLEHDPRHRRITPRMVLSHQTGLPNWGGDPLELQADPGTFGYSGEGFVYLQRVVEAVTGEGLEALARREVFEPLGMASTSYVWRDVFEGRTAAGHDRLGDAVPLQRFEEPNAAFSLVTTAGDYARFLAALMRGEGLRAETAGALRTPWIDAAEWSLPEEGAGRVGWGLGIGVQKGPAGDALWHWGQRPRFTAYAIGYPAEGRGLVVFLNAGHGLSTVEAIVSRFAPDDEHWALAFLGYEPYDSPEQAALQSLLTAFADGGAEAGVRRFRTLRGERPDVVDQDLVGDVGTQLGDAGRPEEAAALYAAYVEAFPDSATGHGWLAGARMRAGEYGRAVESYRRALALDSGSEDHARELAWVEALAAAERSPVDVPVETLARYAGDYGPRHAWMEGGDLHYRRDGGSEFRLVPLSPDTFTLVGLPTFRVRFVDDDGDGTPDRLEGRYFDGRVDATERDPPGNERSAAP